MRKILKKRLFLCFLIVTLLAILIVGCSKHQPDLDNSSYNSVDNSSIISSNTEVSSNDDTTFSDLIASNTESETVSNLESTTVSNTVSNAESESTQSSALIDEGLNSDDGWGPIIG